MPDGVIQSFEVLNYSGLLFNKGNTRTPFSTMISGKRKITQSVSFPTGQEYATEGGSQPSISETASLTAPTPSFVKRDQKENVTQIFHESVAMSYGKESNMQTLSGLNIAGQVENPRNELDFQVAAKMTKIARDIEYTFINGVYAKAANDTTANKTRGMDKAITTNIVAAENAPLTVWMVNDLMGKIYKSNAPVDNLTLWLDGISLNQLNADAAKNGLTIIPASREVNGIQITTLIMPMGEIGVRLGEFVPAGTAFAFNFDAIAPVEQPTPGKGNFFLEPLAKVGAAEQYQIFGQIGLDHGMEWYHGKINGISTSFTPPTV